MTRKAIRNPGMPSQAALPATPEFDPVDLRHRHDGWTTERQIAFIEALAECGCVEEASARVGMSVRSAYTLRRREDAASFLVAWDLALDHAIQRIADAAFSRALHGVSRPVFYKGEQIGERRHYDERLTMFLLRYRDPLRYGNWLDACEPSRAVDGAARELGAALADMADAGTDRALDQSIGDEPWSPRYPLRFDRPQRGSDSSRRGVHVKRRRTPEETDALLRQKIDAFAAQVARKEAAAANMSAADVPRTS